MPDLLITPGGGNSNSFVSLEDYKEFLANRIPLPSYGEDLTGQEFQAAVSNGSLDAILELVLIYGARYLGLLINWNGTITYLAQSLAFPRLGLKDKEGRDVDSESNPSEIKLAQMELATLLLASTDSDIFAEDEALKGNIKKVKADVVEVEFQDKPTTLSAFDLRSIMSDPQTAYLRMPGSVMMYIPVSWYVRELPSVIGTSSKEMKRPKIYTM